MKIKSKIYWHLPIAATMLIASCKKDVSTGIANVGSFTDTSSSTLKAASATAGFSMGTAVNYSDVISNPLYLATTIKDFNYVTFGYQMKHGAVVQNDGS